MFNSDKSPSETHRVSETTLPAQLVIATGGKPVMPASVTTGIPMEPKATGAVFASRQMPAA